MVILLTEPRKETSMPTLSLEGSEQTLAILPAKDPFAIMTS